jgi:5S rRNA maturation endonuclease (ribonuclease M5)
MKKETDVEKLYEIIDELKEKLVIVEGKKDKKALNRLGLKNIIAIGGKPVYHIVEKHSKQSKEIVILTDFDKKGNQLNLKLKNMFQKYRKHVNSRLRKSIMNFGKNKIEDFGSIGIDLISDKPVFKEVDIHVKISTNVNKVRYSRSNKRKRDDRET